LGIFDGNILVGGFNPSEKYYQIGSSSQLLGNMKMFQTTNQILYQDICHSKGGKNPRFFSWFMSGSPHTVTVIS